MTPDFPDLTPDFPSDVNVTGPRSAAPGQTGTTGGGREFSTTGKTKIEIIRVDPLRK
jgi:hypothetical protein